MLLRKLGRLSSRRRLIEDEPYTAAYVMGQLTAQCYEAANEGEGVARSVALTARTKTDHTAGMYLRPIGKCTVTFDSDVIEMTCKGLGDGEETRGVMPYDKLQILNTVYTVSKVDSTRTRVSLKLFLVSIESAMRRPCLPAEVPTRGPFSGAVLILRLNYITNQSHPSLGDID